MLETATLGVWIKKLVAGALLVPAGPLFAILIGLVLARRRRALGTTLASLGALVLFVLALPVVANAIAAPLERTFPPLSSDVPLPPNTAIVVLGGGMQEGARDYGGETINQPTLARLRAAARLAARTRLPVLVTGGPSLTSRTTEASHMAAVLEQEFRTPVRWIEEKSLDTQDNARFAVPMLQADGIATAILVTDTAHMTRSRELFVAAGMPVIPAATDFYAGAPVSPLSFLPSANALRRSAIAVHEWCGLQWARLRR